MTPLLRIEVLGTPVIRNGKTVVSLNRRLLRVLLFYLAVRAEPVSRVELVNLFWPDEENENQGRRALTQTISRLRGDLNTPNIFILQGDIISLNEAVVSTDVQYFRHLIKEVGQVPWRLPKDQPLPEHLYAALKKAVLLWHGGQFMEGFDPENEALENWLSITRQQYEVENHRLLQRLADHETADGKPVETLRWLRKILQVDTTNDELHARVLQLLLDMGRRKEALDYGQQLTVLYQRELAAPLPFMLTALYIKAQETQPGDEETVPNRWKDTGFNLPLTGRQNEMDLLQKAYQQGGILLLSGEAGLGKTRLLQAFSQSLPPQSRCLLADCHPMQSTLPFQPIIEMLRFHISVQNWRSLPPSSLGPITSLLPELQSLSGRSEPGGEALSSSLYEALQQALLHIFRGNRVVLLLDNAQWVDEASLSCLSYLIEKRYFQRALLVVSYQPETPMPYLEAFIEFCQKQPGTRQIELAPLSQKETAELAQQLTAGLPSILMEQLNRDCGGNPFLILETLRSWMQMNPAQLAQTGDFLPVPGSVHALFRERTRPLSANALQMLETAAVVGYQCPLTILEKASHLFIEQTVEALDELQNAGLLRPLQQNGSSGYYFVHDQFRELLLLKLSPARRRLLHLRAANAIQTEYGDGAGSQSSLVARHYQEADEPVLAFDWWLRAAAYARQLFAMAEAGRAYAQAESLFISTEGRFTDDHVERLYTAWGQLSIESENTSVLGQICRAFLKIGQQRKKLRLIGRANSLFAMYYLLCRQFETGLQHIQSALADLSRVWYIPGLIEARNRQAALLTGLSRYTEAVEAYEAALALGADSLDPQMLNMRFSAHFKAALIFTLTGWPVKAEAQIARGQADLGSSISPYNQSRFLLLISMARYSHLDFEAGLAAAKQSQNLARELQNTHQEMQSQTMIIRNTFAMGRLLEAWQALIGAIETCQKYSFLDILAQFYNIRGEIHQALMDYPAAKLAYQKSLEDQKLPFNTYSALGKLGYVSGLTGDLKMGLETIEKAIEGAEKAGTESLAWQARFFQALLLAPQQDVRPCLGVIIREAEIRGFLDWELKARFQLLQQNMLWEPEKDHHVEARNVKDSIWQSNSPWLQVEYMAWMGHASQHRHLGPEKEDLRSLLQRLTPQTADETLQALFKNYCQQMLR